MDLNTTPRSERLHIAILGRRNAGKSSLINALTGQEIAVVSPIKGTTTDPVYKSMELLPIGPVVFIDTAGLDDEGSLGELRKKKTLDVLNKADIAVLVIDGEVGVEKFEENMANLLKAHKLPVVGVVNKVDLTPVSPGTIAGYRDKLGIPIVEASSTTGKGMEVLKKAIIEAAPKEDEEEVIVRDLITPGDFVVLVTPIDKAAPKGRLILPQQQTIRDIIDGRGIAIVVQAEELKEALEGLAKEPRLVITDSQVFHKVAADTPPHIPLTSFSILFARYKGDLEELVKGARAVENLKDGDKVLIAEACTHHRQEDDIARVKIPRWLKQKTGKDLELNFVSGGQFPENLSEYSLIIHCGGCMLNRKAMRYRIKQAVDSGVPIVNYGVFIAYVQGILDRTIEIFN